MVECADKAPHEIPQPSFCFLPTGKNATFFIIYYLKKRFSMKTFKTPF